MYISLPYSLSELCIQVTAADLDNIVGHPVPNKASVVFFHIPPAFLLDQKSKSPILQCNKVIGVERGGKGDVPLPEFPTVKNISYPPWPISVLRP